MDDEEPKVYDPGVAAAWIAERTGLDADEIEDVLNWEIEFTLDPNNYDIDQDTGEEYSFSTSSIYGTATTSRRTRITGWTIFESAAMRPITRLNL